MSNEVGLVPVERWARVGEFLPSSTQHVKAYLKHKRYKVPKHRTTKADTTNEESLETIIRQHPEDKVLPLVLKARHLNKAIGYLSDNIVGRDDCLHPRYTFLPKTGRLSSKRPNLMNLPQGRKGDIMKDVASAIRDSIIPRDGYEIAEFDWRAIEALLTGYFADDPEYIIAARRGVHDIFASHILYKRGVIKEPLSANSDDLPNFKKWLETHHDHIRAIAKKRIYAGSYGQGVINMAKDMGCSVEEVRELDAIFAEMAPKVIKWQKDTRLRAHSEGQLTNPFGYTMTFFEVYRNDPYRGWIPGKEANEALAFLPQSTCAAMLRDTLVYLGSVEQDFGFNLLVPTHDAVSVEFRPENKTSVLSMIKAYMEKPWEELGGLTVETECKVGSCLNPKRMEKWNG